jgi:hypothetical protein
VGFPETGNLRVALLWTECMVEADQDETPQALAFREQDQRFCAAMKLAIKLGREQMPTVTVDDRISVPLSALRPWHLHT